MVKESTKEAPILGLIANVATVASERADTRTWSSLPSGWWAVKISLDAGPYQMKPSFDSRASVRPIQISAGEMQIIVYHRLSPTALFGL